MGSTAVQERLGAAHHRHEVAAALLG